MYSDRSSEQIVGVNLLETSLRSYFGLWFLAQLLHSHIVNSIPSLGAILQINVIFVYVHMCNPMKHRNVLVLLVFDCNPTALDMNIYRIKFDGSGLAT